MRGDLGGEGGGEGEKCMDGVWEGAEAGEGWKVARAEGVACWGEGKEERAVVVG